MPMIDVDNKVVILLAFANEKEIPSGYLNLLEEERRGINEALEEHHDRQLCEIYDEPNTSLDTLFHNFSRFRDKISIFHYGGHASENMLRLRDRLGGNQNANSKGLASLLGQQDQLKLVFLNGCSTQNQVTDMIEAGVPAVIATSTSINDQLAGIFSVQFYKSLAKGASIQEAFDEAKSRVLSQIDPDSELEIKEFRDFNWEEDFSSTDKPNLEDSVSWGLYVSDQTVLDWKLPSLKKRVAFTKSIDMDSLSSSSNDENMIVQTISAPSFQLSESIDEGSYMTTDSGLLVENKVVSKNKDKTDKKKKKKKKKKNKVKIQIEIIVKIRDLREKNK